MHDVPLAALGRVHRGEREPVLVEPGRTGQVAGGLRWVEGEVGEQRRPGAVAARRRLHLGQVFQASLGAVVAMPDDRFQEPPEPLHLGCRLGPEGHAVAQRAAQPVERRPGRGGHGRRRGEQLGEGRGGRGIGLGPHTERLHEAGRRGRPDAVEQPQGPRPRQLVPGVVEQPEQRQQVLHMGGFEEAEPAVLHVGDVATGELELEEVGVPSGPEQHRLLAQVDALVAMTEHRVADRSRLGGLVVTGAQQRTAGTGTHRREHLPGSVPGGGRGHDGVGGTDDGRRRAVVGGQRDHGGAGVQRGEVEDVAGRGGAEAVDRLRVVADDGEPSALGAECVEDVGLEGVGVLVLVDQDVVEGPGHLARGLRSVGEGAPEQQQVVEVEDVLSPLALGDRDQHVADGVDVVPAPGCMAGHDVGQPLLGVHHPAGDAGDGVGAGEPSPSGPPLGAEAE